jgi:1,4-dihydroxy-2-naphthoate polyprenyltransferase
MASVKIWLKAIRAPFFTATLVPVLLGSTLAWHNTSLFSWPFFFLILIAALFMHAGTNLSNDFFDHVSGNDVVNKTPTPFSGGSRVIQEKLIPAKQILMAAVIFFAAGSILGVYLNFKLPGNTLILFGSLGLFLGFFYTAPPFRLGYSGVGEMAVGLGFGPLAVLSSYFVQAKTLSYEAFFASIPIGILIALVLFINEFPDYGADRKVGKKTMVVLIGKKKSAFTFILFAILAYLWILLGVFYGLMPYLALITFFTLPIMLIAISKLIKNYDKIEELLPANKSTIMIHLLFGTALVLGYLLDKLL